MAKKKKKSSGFKKKTKKKLAKKKKTAASSPPMDQQELLPLAVKTISEEIEIEEKPRRPRKGGKETAQTLAAKQRDISVSEFFAKNRHLLGFDNPSKSLLTTIKEAVDNSLDACEDAHIMPTIDVQIKMISEDRFEVIVEDNGPGIVKAQIPKIFGKLLYGSKFHTMKQSRGQQGIGISAACMYAQLTTGKPVKITSRVGAKKPAHYFEMRLDTQRNMPVILTDKVVDYKHDHGTRIHLELQGTYKKGRHSVDGYLQQIALANPHASIFYHPPKPDPGEEIIEFPRVVDKLPREALEILPHPYGVELGVLLKMAHISRSHSLVGFLSKDFSRVSTRLAEEICKTAGVESSLKPEKIHLEDAEKLYKAILNTKIMAPSANCLSPIGEEVIQRGLEQNIKAAFYACVTRSPSVYRGNPFQIEVGVAWGGDLPGDGLCALYRFANRVPLQYQQAACAITKAVNSIAWSSYGVQQSKGALPTGPLLILIHIASVWVPFTSESKEAIAHYPEILKELRLAIQECARKLQSYLRRRQKEFDAAKKKSYIEKYIPHIGIALREILSLSEKEEQKVVSTLKDTLERSRG